MLKTLNRRKIIAEFVLFIAIIGAIYIAIPGDGIGLPELVNFTSEDTGILIDIIDALNAKASAHILGHIVIFGGVAGLLGYWGLPHERGNAELALRFVLLGAALMETGQVIVGYSDDTLTQLIVGVTFDVVVDLLAAMVALWITRRYANSLTILAMRLHLA